MAVGTDTGAVFVWDIRRSVPRSSTQTSTIYPVRNIFTDSPVISCIALTSLYLVHGGSDGLVQAWDTLASRIDPVRTISGRPSGRFRRQIMRSHAAAISLSGFPTAYEYNHFAVGSISLDNEPTFLRGVVSIGSTIRTWAFRSADIDRRVVPKSGTKRRRRRASDRRGSGALKGLSTGAVTAPFHIKHELAEVRREREADDSERRHLAKRFGVGMYTEQEEMQMALLLSSETFEVETKRASPPSSPLVIEEEDEVAEAIRRSLLDSPPPSFDPARSWSEVAKQDSLNEVDEAERMEQEELEMALLLSLQEEGQTDETVGQFPELPSRQFEGKGKGRSHGQS